MIRASTAEGVPLWLALGSLILSHLQLIAMGRSEVPPAILRTQLRCGQRMEFGREELRVGCLAPAHLRPAIALMMFTGLGPADALKLPRSLYKDGAIASTFR